MPVSLTQLECRGPNSSGSLSPLLAAVMLIPLDEAMNGLWRRYGLFYVRYMDDFVIMAPTRHKRTPASSNTTSRVPSKKSFRK